MATHVRICTNRLHHPGAHPLNEFCTGDPAAALRRLVQAALSYQASVMWDDEHPDNPHGDAELEYKQDALDEAVCGYVWAKETGAALEDTAHSWAAAYVDREHPWNGLAREPATRGAAYTAATVAYVAGRRDAATPS